ncbi:hypothetical protein ANN_06711 [Periplaneta americana]|uniref:Tc1-like transposase DDE domain-containing protein n=1 Tax=Periplaneta americana TaxID=6978 RepID=A0ABQ8TF14_PERAM|nr:hypothetical protein ANN_06711 [Periplaneta americana]
MDLPSLKSVQLGVLSDTYATSGMAFSVIEARKLYRQDKVFVQVKVAGYTAKNKKEILYPNIPSAIRAVPLGPDIPVPLPRESDTLPSASSSTETESPVDHTYEPDNTGDDRYFNQIELNDLARDLNLPKESAELLGSRLKEKKVMAQGYAAYATLRQDFDWRNVIFSDEVIVSNSNDSTALVYCMNGHRYDERFVRRIINKSGCVRVACWGWMSYDGAGLLERIYGRFTAEVYKHILANVMIPSARKRYPEGTLFFQQDNHPIHTANRIQRWFTRRRDVDPVDWPSNSPDMNPIQNSWAAVKRILRSNWAE